MLGTWTAILHGLLPLVTCVMGSELRTPSPQLLRDAVANTVSVTSQPVHVTDTTATTFNTLKAAANASNPNTSPSLHVLRGSTPTFHFLHIGKNAGSTIKRALIDYIATNAHTGAPRIKLYSHAQSIEYVKRRFVYNIPLPGDEGKVLFWLRAPVHRFTSAWISKYRTYLPAHSPLRAWELPHVTNIAAERKALAKFDSPDELGCALSSPDPQQRREATSVFGTVRHVNTPQSTYLQGVETVRKMRDSIAFVGRVEHFPEDWKRMVDMLVAAGALTRALPLPDEKHVTPDYFDRFKRLGKCSVDNVRSWYAEDYRVIEKLASFGLVSKEYPAEVDVLDEAPNNGASKIYF